MARAGLKVELVVRKTAPFGMNATKGSLSGRIRKFKAAERAAAAKAAAVANQVSRGSFEHLRPLAPARAGRTSTQGQLTSFIDWKVTPNGVTLDTAKLDHAAPHWIIQEIGTGKSARLREGGNATGTEDEGPSIVRTVRSQLGRRISGNLVFATGPAGRYTPPIAARSVSQNLYLRSRIKGVPARTTDDGIVIRREIKGQHFIQKGAQAGFRQYRSSVLEAARNSFAKGAEL